jgi:hypothetical protein
MTIAISLKVNDGLVLAADSASTIVSQSEEGETNVVNVYNHANKIANLRKGLPIGAVTWGSGSIGAASISTLLKDLRRRFTDDGEWHLDQGAYTIEEAANRLRPRRALRAPRGSWRRRRRCGGSSATVQQ